MLTQDILKELLHFNPETGEFTWLYRDVKWFKRNQDCIWWNKRYAGSKAGHDHYYKNCNKTYLVIFIFGKGYLAHRLAFLYMTGVLPDEEIDHKDHDGLNNKWGNLRIAGMNENAKNHSLQRNNKSGIAGVYWIASKNRWVSQIGGNSTRLFLGHYIDLFEACCARKSAELMHNYHPNHGQAL